LLWPASLIAILLIGYIGYLLSSKADVPVTGGSTIGLSATGARGQRSGPLLLFRHLR
jgi:hypothetical protein